MRPCVAGMVIFLATVFSIGGARADPRDDFLAHRSRACPKCDPAGVSFTRRDLAGADLAGADLRGANFHDAQLAGAKPAGADLTGANLNKANLAGADLAGAILRRPCCMRPSSTARHSPAPTSAAR